MQTARGSSLKLLLYIGVGVLGFGLFVFTALLIPALNSQTLTYPDWTVIVIYGFPIAIGSFLIYLGRK